MVICQIGILNININTGRIQYFGFKMLLFCPKMIKSDVFSTKSAVLVGKTFFFSNK